MVGLKELETYLEMNEIDDAPELVKPYLEVEEELKLSPHKIYLGDLSWQERALCLNQWDIYDATDKAASQLQRGLCGLCPVKKECLDYAMALERGWHRRYLRFGDKSPVERKRADSSLPQNKKEKS